VVEEVGRRVVVVVMGVVGVKDSLVGVETGQAVAVG